MKALRDKADIVESCYDKEKNIKEKITTALLIIIYESAILLNENIHVFAKATETLCPLV